MLILCNFYANQFHANFVRTHLLTGFLSTVACSVNNPCGENALCLSEDYRAVCFCREGFVGDPLTRCKPIDFCRSSPCAGGATCENKPGSFKCLCPLGTIGDPYELGCQPAVECKVNGDCPSTAVCRTENGEPKCVDVCETTQCGANADCKATNHKAFCVCRQGYDGEPNDVLQGCRPSK